MNDIPQNILEVFKRNKNIPWLEQKGLPAAESVYRYWHASIEASGVDRNLLLYRLSKSITEICLQLKFFSNDPEKAAYFLETAKLWDYRSKTHKQEAIKYLWNERRETFYDPNVKPEHIASYSAANCIYALWAGIFETTDFKERRMLDQTIKYLVSGFEGAKGMHSGGGKELSAIQQAMFIHAVNDYATKLKKSGWKEVAERAALRFILNHNSFRNPEEALVFISLFMTAQTSHMRPAHNQLIQ